MRADRGPEPAVNSASSNLCAAWPAGVKLGLALCLAIVVGLISPEHWPATGVVGVLTLAAHALADTPTALLWRRLGQITPFVVLFASAALWNGTHGTAGVWTAAFTLRCYIAFLIGLWLTQVLTASQLLRELRRWHCPPALVAVLGFQLRYLVVLWDEHERLHRAQLARAGGPLNRWARWVLAIERLGLLLLRAIDRSERVHRAMLARGWDGGTRSWE